MSFILEHYDYRYNIDASNSISITRDDLLDSIQYEDRINAGYKPLCFTKIFTGNKDIVLRSFSSSCLAGEWTQGGNVILLKNTSNSKLTNLTLQVEIIWTNENIGTFSEIPGV